MRQSQISQTRHKVCEIEVCHNLSVAINYPELRIKYLLLRIKYESIISSQLI